MKYETNLLLDNLCCKLLEAVEERDHAQVELWIEDHLEASGAIERQNFPVGLDLDVRIAAERNQVVLLELHADFIGQARQKQSRLTPGRVDLIPLNRDTRQAAQPATT